MRSVLTKSLPHAVSLSTSEQFPAPQTRLRKSAESMREAEKRKGIPKLDSACMLAPFELTKVGGGEHCVHFIRAVWTAWTMVSSGDDISFESVMLLPSSHVTSTLSAVSDRLTQRVVLTFAEACCVSVAARPVWQTPPWSVVNLSLGMGGLSDL